MNKNLKGKISFKIKKLNSYLDLCGMQARDDYKKYRNEKQEEVDFKMQMELIKQKKAFDKETPFTPDPGNLTLHEHWKSLIENTKIDDLKYIEANWV